MSLFTKSDDFDAVAAIVKEPTGFIDNTESAYSFIDASRTFTIQPTGTSFRYYQKGTLHTVFTSKSITISNVEGLHFIYFDGETLFESTTFSQAILSDYVYVCNIYWDATNNLNILVGDERHGCVLDWNTHLYLHLTRGTVLQNGGALGDISPDATGNLEADIQFSNGQTVIWDEDLTFTLLARAKTDVIHIFYRSGTDSSNTWRSNASVSTCVMPVGTGRAAYNLLSGGSWSAAEATNDNFILAHVFSYNCEINRFGIIMGQAQYNTLAQVNRFHACFNITFPEGSR